MPRKPIYLDYASTTPLHPEVFDAYSSLLKDHFYNVDALYDGALALRQLMETARNKVVELLGLPNWQLVFTSGASEANNMVIQGLMIHHRDQADASLVISAVEHSSIKAAAKFVHDYYGVKVIEIPVTPHGLDMDALKDALDSHTVLVSIMAVNNETGMIFDMPKIIETVRQNSHAMLHVDCVQAIGKMDLPWLNAVDFISLSAHKFHGLKGSGALIGKHMDHLVGLIHAGQQEQGLRGGTSNALVNIMLAKTLRLALDEKQKAIENAKQCFDYCMAAFCDDLDFHVNSKADGTPFIFNVSARHVTSQVLLNALSARGIEVSATSTCESAQGHSDVLAAMGYDQWITTGSCRLSFDGTTTLNDVRFAVDTIKEVCKKYATR